MKRIASKIPWCSCAQKWLYCLVLMPCVCAGDLPDSAAHTEGSSALPERQTPTDKDLRRRIGERYIRMTQAIDNFFSASQIEAGQNKSFLKGEMRFSQFDSGATRYDVRLRAKVDLPASEKRLKLFFDSDIREEDELAENFRSVSTGKRINDESVAGVEIKADDKRYGGFKPSLHLGTKLNRGINPFVRLRIKNQYMPHKQWSLGLRQDFWYLDAQGWGETTRVELRHPINQRMLFLTVSEIEYIDQDNQWEAAHRWVVSHRLSDSFGLDYQLGHIEDTKNAQRFDRHFININFRKKLSENWLFLTITPEIAYYYNEQWNTQGSVTAKLELFFTD